MTISVPCSCGHIVEVRAEKMNRRVVCPMCRQAFWATSPSPSISSSQSRPVVVPRPQVQPPPLPPTATGLPSVESLSEPRPPGLIPAPGLLGWFNHHRPLLTIGVFVAALVLALGAIAGFRQVGERTARQIADVGDESADDPGGPGASGSGGGGAAPGGEPGAAVNMPPGLLNPPAAENAPDRALPAPAPSSPSKTLTTQEIVARCEASVALVKGRSGSGTGFIVRPGIIATNAHVIAHEPSRALQIYFPSAPEKDRGPVSAQLTLQGRAP